MAWFTYECPDHGHFRLKLTKRSKKGQCPKCGQDSNCVIRSGSVSVVERLDNGAMARVVERPHNVEELLNDRIPERPEDADTE